MMVTRKARGKTWLIRSSVSCAAAGGGGAATAGGGGNAVAGTAVSGLRRLGDRSFKGGSYGLGSESFSGGTVGWILTWLPEKSKVTKPFRSVRPHLMWL